MSYKVKEYYRTEPERKFVENTGMNVLKSFRKDFIDGNPTKIIGIRGIVENLKRFQDTIELKGLEEGYSGKFIRPLEKYKKHKEKPHPIEIREFRVSPDKDYDYSCKISFYDRGGDLHSFLILIDGIPYKRGIFVGGNSFTSLGTRGTEETDMIFCCNSDSKGNLYGFQGRKVKMFGNLEKGKHKLMFYAMDARGNRSFAVTEYEI